MIKFYSLKRFLLIVLMLSTLNVWAQEKVVTGKVTSSDDGTGLPGVSILEKGTSNGTVTDGDGNFSISVNGNAVLVFSFVGFASQEVAVANRSTVDITLQTDITSLDEIVVVGYGEVEKKDATGAVMNMSSRDFNKGVLTSPQDLIVGKFAGVSVTTTNGAPGSGATIRIRGGSSLTATNDPLIVIDGYPVDNSTPAGVSNALASLNPNDIETYTVLKDASAAAIYGSRAANGVIIITTKRGKAGKMQLSYNGNVAVSTPAKYLDVLSGDEYRALVDQMEASGDFGITPGAKDLLGDQNTDWQKEIFRTAISHDHNLSASGALKNIPYRISYGYTDQEGILKTTNLVRNSLNINLNPSLLNDDLKLNLSLKGSHTNTNFGDAAAVGNAISFDPTQPVRDGNELYGGYFSWLSFTDVDGDPIITNGNSNPVAMLEQTDNQSSANRIIANAQVEYRLPFFRDIKANLNVGFDKAKSDGYNRAPLNSGFIHNTGTLVGRNNTYFAENRSELLDFYLNYSKETGMHKVDITAGYGWQHFYRDGGNTDSNEATTTSRQFKNENYLVSFFGRANYTLNGKYLLTATLRNDGSSRFAKENRWGLFPSLALAWRIKDEDFLTNVSVVSDLKLRAGYGVTGQQDIPLAYYPYLAAYRSSDLLAQYQLGNNFYQTLRPEAYDANIKWEESTTYNLGLDFGFANDRITGSIEVFEKNTEDLLNYIAIANGVNFSNFLTTNVGSMKNQGIEVTVNGMVVSKPDFSWNVGVNFTSINSEITRLNLTDDPTYPGVNVGNIGVDAFIQNHQVGYPAFSYLTYQQVYDQAGNPIEGLYVDRSGEGGSVVGNNNNKYRNHRPVPDFLVGLNSRVNYKKFDFSFSSRLSIGNYVYNRVESGNAFYNNVYSLQHFRNIPSYVSDTKFVGPQQYSDYYVQNASFFKMDNISAGYSFENVFTDKVKARLSLTLQNAFVITKYKGIDPELDGGLDNNIYPRPRTFLLGLNVTF
jgi:TonB-dependent starch-binding outer membrane protein SusC